MTVMFYQSAEAVQSETSQSWVEIASKVGTLRARTNFLQVYAEYGGTVIDEPVGIRCLVNGTEQAFDYHTPTIAAQYQAFSVFGIIEPSVEAEYTISLEVRTLSAGQTVNVRRIRLFVMQE